MDQNPGEDPAGRFSAAGPEGRWAVAARRLQAAGFHPLLGQVPQGALGGEAEDGGGPLPARSQAHRELVSAVSARAGLRAVDGTQAEAVGALCLFRHHRKFQSAPQLPAPGHRRVAKGRFVLNLRMTEQDRKGVISERSLRSREPCMSGKALQARSRRGRSSIRIPAPTPTISSTAPANSSSYADAPNSSAANWSIAPPVRSREVCFLGGIPQLGVLFEPNRRDSFFGLRTQARAAERSDEWKSRISVRSQCH